MNKILIRKTQCNGCCFGNTPMAHDAKQGMKAVKADEDRKFRCHEYAECEPDVLCHLYAKAYPERVEGEKVYVRFKGLLHRWWKFLPAGSGEFLEK
jgi:hypothetical protein